VIKAVEETPKSPGATGPSRSRRVLVVEDNEDARESLRILIELKGHEVHAVSTGEEGIRGALEWRPDVALIDLGLPDLDGREVARRIRVTPPGARVYLVALTGFGQTADRERALEAGFDAHAVKPIELELLFEVLGRERG
jgi:CheY-like chemotaxis protein